MGVERLTADHDAQRSEPGDALIACGAPSPEVRVPNAPQPPSAVTRMSSHAWSWHRSLVRPVSTILDRFRRAAAVPAGVGDDLARELAPVFAALDEIESECDRVRADAVATAERRVAETHAVAAADSAWSRQAAETARAEAEAERRRALEEEAPRLRREAEAEARRVRAQGETRLAELVDAVVACVRAEGR